MKLFKKYGLNKATNIGTSLFLFLFSFIHTVGATPYLFSGGADNTFIAYFYKFGLIFPWIELHSYNDLGPMNIFQFLNIGSQTGVAWYPQNIFFSLLAINLFVIPINMMIANMAKSRRYILR